MIKFLKESRGLILYALIFIIIGSWILISICNKAINKYKVEYTKHMGERVIIGKDTLSITDYSMIEENFTLSNGRKISKSYLENIQALPKK